MSDLVFARIIATLSEKFVRARAEPSLLALLRIACLAVTAFAMPAPAQSLPPGMTMHRLQAGEPDASGWMLAASTQGGFSAKLPIRFNDFTVAETDPSAATLRVHTVGTKSSEGIKFSASRISYRKGAQSAKQSFDRFKQGSGFNPKPERIAPLRVGDRQAVDLVVANAASISYQRAVLLDADLLLMVVETPREHEALARPLVQPFFDSLVVSAR